ncbi:hypothetical protein BH09SUM1_BH09SUM1_15570 [soil metagenome]
MATPFRIGLIGFGNIGAGLVRHVMEHADLLADRVPGGVELTAIADVEFERDRGVKPGPGMILTTSWRDLIEDKSIEAIVELVGVGRDGKPSLAYEIAKATLGAGKDFVTANKALIATHGAELEELARANNAMLLYEASVGAGIPLIATMQGALAPDRITQIHGIVNGTCNYILTRIEDDSALTMEAAIAEAQQLGYAEPNPAFDVDGDDAAYKVVILGSLAFGQEVPLSAVRKDGITRLGEPEFSYARENGLAVKLLVSAEHHRDGTVELSVAPTFIPARHVLANVRGVYNGVLINGEPIGETMYYGRGAGQASTASGLLSDVLIAARRRRAGAPNPHSLRIPRGGFRPAPAASSRASVYLRVKFSGEIRSAEALLAAAKGELLSRGPEHAAVRMPQLANSEIDNLLETLTQKGVPLERICCVRYAFA